MNAKIKTGRTIYRDWRGGAVAPRQQLANAGEAAQIAGAVCAKCHKPIERRHKFVITANGREHRNCERPRDYV